MDFDEQIKIHDYCVSNYKDVKRSKNVGCFHCCEIYPATEVKDWIEGKRNDSAVCPKCEMDAVLPDSKVVLTKELLTIMQEYWFGEDED